MTFCVSEQGLKKATDLSLSLSFCMPVDEHKDFPTQEQLSDCVSEQVQQLRRENAALKLKNDILTTVISKLNSQTNQGSFYPTSDSTSGNSCSSLLIKLEEMSHEKVSIIQSFEQEEGISFY
jgi:hypothetical protein